MKQTRVIGILNYITIRVILLIVFFVIYNNDLIFASVVFLIVWIIAELAIKRERVINTVAVGVHNALQHHNLKNTSYLKFFRSIDEDFDFYKEYEEIFNFNLNSGSEVPFAVRLFENPDYDWFLPSIFHGRHGLKEHDFAHLLLSRGFNVVDEICVVGTVAGSTRKMNWFNTPIFYLAQWIFYPRVFRFPLKYYPIWKAYVGYGALLKKNLSKIEPEAFKHKSAREIRAEIGIFKTDLVSIYKQEAFDFGVNSRLLDGLLVSEDEMLAIEYNTKEIIVISSTLHDDLYSPKTISVVRRNLKKETSYIWILPDTKVMRERAISLRNMHNSPNLTITTIPEDEFNQNYGEAEDILFYDGVISLFKTGHDQYLIKAI